MTRWILGIVIGLVAIVGLAWIVGLMLPKRHLASRTVTFAATPAVRVAAISDVKRYPEWRSDVKRIAVEGDGGQGSVVREENKNGTIPYRIEVIAPPNRLVMRIADPK